MPRLRFALPGDERFNMIMSVVAFLQREGEISLEDLASHFDVSTASMRAMLSTINVSSFMPRNSEERLPYFIDLDRVDEEDGIVLLEFDEKPQGVPVITAAQAVSLVSGLEYLKTLPGFRNSKDVEELLTLLRTVQPKAPLIGIEQKAPDADLEVLQSAILTNRRIKCHYVNTRGEETFREIDPLLLVAGEDRWYLKGYCLNRAEVRSFRLDHMVDAVILDQERSEEALAAAATIDEMASIYTPKSNDVEVVLELAPEAYKLATVFTQISEPRPTETENVRVNIRLGYLPDLGPLVCRFGQHARVISPPEAIEVVRKFAEHSLSTYQPTDIE